MSYHLDQLLGAERQAACAANDAKANAPALNRYIVREFRHGTLQRKYERQAEDVVAALTDAQMEAPVDCKLDVMSASDFAELEARDQFARSPETQAWHAENARHAARGGVL